MPKFYKAFRILISRIENKKVSNIVNKHSHKLDINQKFPLLRKGGEIFDLTYTMVRVLTCTFIEKKVRK